MQTGMFRSWRNTGLGLAALMLATPALADGELRDLCPTRPGLATPPCIVDTGHVLAELGVADWTVDKQAGVRTDAIISGDLLLRYGLDDQSEVQIGMTGFGTVRTRDASGISHSSGVGDLTLGYKRSIVHPGGNGFSAALQPFLTLPTGGRTIGAGDWSGGVMVPMAVPIAQGVSLELTPEIDAAVNVGGKGRHFAAQTVEGLSFSLTPSVSTSVEVEEVHDEDPSGTQDHALAGLSVAWQPTSNWQLDLGTVAGLDLNSAGVEVYFGISRRF